MWKKGRDIEGRGPTWMLREVLPVQNLLAVDAFELQMMLDGVDYQLPNVHSMLGGRSELTDYFHTSDVQKLFSQIIPE